MIDRDNSISSALSLIGGTHICAKALLDIKAVNETIDAKSRPRIETETR